MPSPSNFIPSNILYTPNCGSRLPQAFDVRTIFMAPAVAQWLPWRVDSIGDFFFDEFNDGSFGLVDALVVLASVRVQRHQVEPGWHLKTYKKVEVRARKPPKQIPVWLQGIKMSLTTKGELGSIMTVLNIVSALRRVIGIIFSMSGYPYTD